MGNFLSNIFEKESIVREMTKDELDEINNRINKYISIYLKENDEFPVEYKNHNGLFWCEDSPV